MKHDYKQPYLEYTHESIAILSADNDDQWAGDSDIFRNSLIVLGVLAFSLAAVMAVEEHVLSMVIAWMPL